MFNPQQPQQGYTPEQLLQFANLQQQAQQQAQQLNQFNNQHNVLMQQQPTNQASANGQNAASLAGLTQQQINLLASQNLQPNGMQNPFLVNQYLNQQQQVQQFQVAQSVHAHAQLEFQQSFQTNFEAIQRLQALNNANSMQTGDSMQTDDQFAVQLLAQQNLLLAQQQNLGQGLNVQGMGQSLGMNQTMGQNLSQNMSMNQNIGQNMGQNMGQTMGQTMGQNIGQTMGQTMGQTNQGLNQNLNQQFDLNMASQSHIQSLNNNLTNSSMNLSQMDTGSVNNFYPQVGTPTNLNQFQVPQTPSSARTNGHQKSSKQPVVQTHSKVIFKSAKSSNKDTANLQTGAQIPAPIQAAMNSQSPSKSVVGGPTESSLGSMADSAFIGSNSSVGSTSPGQNQQKAVVAAPECTPHEDGLNITSAKFPVLQANPQVHVPCTAKCYHRCKLGLACPRHAHKHLEKMQRKQKQAENGEVVTSSTGCHPKKQQKTDGKLKSIETITSGSCISNSGSSVLSQLTGQNNQQKTDKNGNKRTFLDLYEVYNVIGVGGGGMVYSGRRIADKLPVAIKRVMREKVKRWETVQGYQVPQEIALMLRCYGHPGVIRLVDWYECLDSFILIMERPERAVDLFDYIREVGRINEQEAARIFSSVLDATQHIMGCGVVHRDLKDENIIMNRDTGEAKIIDFGCGTLLRENAYRDFSGTPEFYPPEWFTTREYYARTAAVWSLGVLLFDMLQGEIPFKQKEKIVENNPSYKHSLSPEAKHLVQWLMSTDPKNRPTMEDIVNHPWLSQYRNQVA